MPNAETAEAFWAIADYRPDEGCGDGEKKVSTTTDSALMCYECRIVYPQFDVEDRKCPECLEDMCGIIVIKEETGETAEG